MPKRNKLKEQKILQHLGGGNASRKKQTAPATESGFAELLAAGRRAVAQTGTMRGDDYIQDTRRTGLAGVNGSVSLRAYLPDLLNDDAKIYAAPAVSALAGERLTMEEAVIENSRVLMAGAHLIYPGLGMEPKTADGVVYLESRPRGLVTVEPATLAPVVIDELTGDGTATASPLPVHEAAIDRDAFAEAGQRVVRFEILRSEQKAKTDELLSYEIMTALALGIGRAADACLLEAINASTPAAFSFGSAAAAGLHFDDLAALVGTNGTGAAVVNELLTVQGVPAELTGDSAATIVGAFDRAAVVVSDNIDLLIERNSAAGKLTVTCWLNMQALLPEPGKFWSVTA